LNDNPTPETGSHDGPGRDSHLIAAFGYIPMLFFVPLVALRSDPFARFHGFQSLVLFAALVVARVAIWVSDVVLDRIMGSMFLIGFMFKAIAWLIHYPVGIVVSCAYAVLVVMGIVQAAAGNYWRIPIMGAYADRLRA
jgi:uncharacterized membrane protein